MAVVTFGGAYAVLAYVAQAAVTSFGWLAPGEMVDGLGLAETTPGPLILVLQFVGFVAAYRHAGAMSPLIAGSLGSLLTLWVTFVPCFFWIFLGAPYIEALRQNKALSAALGAITAAVVGVVMNLALWFALHVVFGAGAQRWPRDGDPGTVLAGLACGTAGGRRMVAMLQAEDRHAADAGRIGAGRTGAAGTVKSGP